MATIGQVTRQKDGRYVGKLKTFSIDAAIEITPVGKKEDASHPDFRITSQGIDIGAAWKRIGQVSKKEYVSASVSAPEFGTLYFNLGKAAGQADPNVFALIWNEKAK